MEVLEKFMIDSSDFQIQIQRIMRSLPQFCLLVSCFILAGCGGDGSEATTGTQPPAVRPVSTDVEAVSAVSVGPPPAAGPNSTPQSSPAPNAGPASAPGGNTGDPLAGFRTDEEGKKRSDLEVLQLLVSVSGLGSDSEGAPTTTVLSLDELVTRKTIRAIPAPPAGKKWHCERGKVSLVDAN